jgi:hypothetical protein
MMSNLDIKLAVVPHYWGDNGEFAITTTYPTMMAYRPPNEKEIKQILDWPFSITHADTGKSVCLVKDIKIAIELTDFMDCHYTIATESMKMSVRAILGPYRAAGLII